MSDAPPKPTYSQEEVTEILKRALRQQSLKNQVLSHDELVEMADEVGIDREALEAATADLAQTRAVELARQSEDREIAEERTRLFSQFVSSLLVYVLVNALLYLVDRQFSHGTWFYWVLLSWGIVLVFQLRRVFFPQESLKRRKVKEAKLSARLERRAQRDALRRRMREAFGGYGAPELVSARSKEFETAVQAGVAALLTVAARKIHAHAERASVIDPRAPSGRRRS
jgi:hypothetical protein